MYCSVQYCTCRRKREESANTIYNLTYLFLTRGKLIDVSNFKRSLWVEHEAPLQKLLSPPLANRLRRQR